jgi:hypothetical protein
LAGFLPVPVEFRIFIPSALTVVTGSELMKVDTERNERQLASLGAGSFLSGWWRARNGEGAGGEAECFLRFHGTFGKRGR